jgi:hypothetical protein
MSVLLQHVAALSVVALCFGYVGWQGVQALRGKRSRVGSCCAKGCGNATAGTPTAEPKPQVMYIPISSLSRRRKA